MTAKFGLLIDAKTKGENNIKRLGNTMQGVEGKAKNLGIAVRGVGLAFKAFFAAAAIGGFSAFVKSTIDAADAFGKLSTRTGIAANQLQAYANAGKLADVSQSDLETGLRTLARTQAEAADGVKTYSEAYAKLGLSVTGTDGSLKASDELLAEIADRFADLPNGPEKAAVAMDIFGRSGSKLITLLNGGSEALERFNYETSENFAQNAELFNDKITTLQIQFDGFRAQLADALLPALNSIIEAFSTMFSAEADFTGFFQAVEIAIRGVGISIAATVMGITEIVELIKAAATAIGAISLGRFDEASQAVSDFTSGAATRFATNKEVMDQLLGRIEAPTDYGGGATGLDPVTLRQSATGSAAEDKEALRIEKERVQIGRKIVDFTLQRVAAFSELLQGLADEKALLEGKLAGNEEEVALAIKVREETEGLPPLIAKAVEERIRGNAALQDAVDKQAEQNEKAAEEAQKLDDLYKNIGNTITSSIGGALEGLIFQSRSLGESLSDMAKSLSKMFLQFGVQTLMGSLGGIFQNAKGNVFAENKIVPFAYGGIVDKPTLFPMANGAGLMGEAGPEAIMPLRRGADGRLGVEASGGGMGGIVVNVDATGSTVEGDQQQSKQLGQAIGAAVQAEIIKQKMPGGLLN
jgi:hypothetical protein|tara:strand:- start:821 stop:2737 length:1917 start_codon:yes stop_codon:yes gene_type:complete